MALNCIEIYYVKLYFIKLKLISLKTHYIIVVDVI